jgi:hypothetical protein
MHVCKDEFGSTWHHAFAFKRRLLYMHMCTDKSNVKASGVMLCLQVAITIYACVQGQIQCKGTWRHALQFQTALLAPRRPHLPANVCIYMIYMYVYIIYINYMHICTYMYIYTQRDTNIQLAPRDPHPPANVVTHTHTYIKYIYTYIHRHKPTCLYTCCKLHTYIHICTHDAHKSITYLRLSYPQRWLDLLLYTHKYTHYTHEPHKCIPYLRLGYIHNGGLIFEGSHEGCKQPQITNIYIHLMFVAHVCHKGCEERGSQICIYISCSFSFMS